MNGKERVEAAIKGNPQDRVPVMCQLSLGHIIKNSGVSPAEFFLNFNDVYPGTIEKLIERYEFDGALLESLGLDMQLLNNQVDKIVDETDGQTIKWKNGGETFCPVNDYPIHRPKVKPVKKSLMEYKASDMLPKEYKYKLNDLPDYVMDPYKRIIKKLGNTYSIHAYFFSPFSTFLSFLGVEEALINLIDYPDVSKDFLEKLTDACIIWTDTLIDIGIPAICASAPYEGSGFISMSMFNEFCYPYLKRIIQHIKSRNIPSYFHMCGSINDRLEKIVETGTDGIECLDPYPLGNVELDEAVKRLENKVFIKGNIDPVNTLLRKTPQEIYIDAVNRIRIAAPTKRFILSSACSVAPDTPVENLRILKKAAEDCGQF